jgi:hypothetical protein
MPTSIPAAKTVRESQLGTLDLHTQDIISQKTPAVRTACRPLTPDPGTTAADHLSEFGRIGRIDLAGNRVLWSAEEIFVDLRQ